jgi:hypothetical protein
MFSAAMLERAEGRVAVPDSDSRVLEQMLEFIYTKATTLNLGEHPEVAQGLLAAADKYQLGELKVMV